MAFLPGLSRKVGVLFCSKGKSRLGWLVHRKTCSFVAVTKVNLKEKCSLAKLGEAIKTNYNGRYGEICFHREGNVLGPKFLAQIAKLGKAKI